MEDKLYEQNGNSSNQRSLPQTDEIITNDGNDNKQSNEKIKVTSLWQFICHISNKKDFVLITLGAIGSIFSAISGPIMSHTFGGAINDFSDVYELDKDDPTYEIKIQHFVENVRKTITKYLVIGSILFVANFFQAFGWQYSAFRQIHTLKKIILI